MKAAYLIKYGSATDAFQIREIEMPVPGPIQVLIKVEAFGINFADVMARLGLYRGAPPLPALLGYDVVGQVEQVGGKVKHLQKGDRVTALTRFGGYAQYALAESYTVYKVPESFSPGIATALATQYTTAHFLSYQMANLQRDDRVLIHAAAGGVGTALVQLAKNRGCQIFGTCSSKEKIEYLKQAGVDHPINYVTNNFSDVIKKIINNHGLDVIFDPIGGYYLRSGYKLLTSGGRIIFYGMSSINSANSIFSKLKVLAQFGIYHPLQYLSDSRGIIGVNMLKIGDENPDKVSKSMQEVVSMTESGILHPYIGGEFSIDQLAEAHAFLESRRSMGKIVVKW